jgi:hypothetical protein
MTLPDSPDSAAAAAAAAARRADPSIPREALERVLARASQLQADVSDAPEIVSEARLLEIAREVGIDTTHLQQALAEERVRAPLAPEDHGPILDSLGPASMSVQRVVPGTPTEILAKLDSWMPRMEAVLLLRRTGERVSWEPRRDAIGNFLRSLGMGGRRFDLIRLDQVAATVTAVDAERSVVRFDIEARRGRRAQRNVVIGVAGGMLLVALGISMIASVAATASAVGALIGTMAVVAAGASYAAWRGVKYGYREMLGRAHLRVEQLLDELETGGLKEPPSLARQVTAALLR